ADAIDPTLSDSVVINLAPGTYVLICLLQSADGVPHAAKGMMQPVQVVPGTVPQTTEPTAAQTVTMMDFLFDMPSSFNAGKIVVEVVNNGPQPHEWGVLQLAPGKTGKDVADWNTTHQGPPPFSAVGGMNGLSVNSSGYAELDFKLGNCIAICNIPDVNSGQPHSALGMVKEFTVK
ncbi:MAG: hypothetical protein LC737_04760, partial [Chloroflexi bacterium]|nr:hypothetical protein [Chloroflexota bacterium]